MKSFADFTLSKPRKNLHMDHLDESAFIGGEEAAEESISTVFSMFEGSDFDIGIKYDGAPAIFAGIDPADGQFFVGTKSVFNKNPKLYKTFEDIEANENGGKAEKLLECLRLLPKLHIPEGIVLQGDLLWTAGDHKYFTYEGVRYVGVHPNTLMYGWVAESDDGHAVRNAELGIVFHTTYSGRDSLQFYDVQFGADISILRPVNEIWVADSKMETPDLTEIAHSVRQDLMAAREFIQCFDSVNKVMESIPSAAIGAKMTTFFNTCIREGMYPDESFYEDYVNYVKSYWNDRMIDKVITEAAKDKKRVQLEQLLDEVHNKEPDFVNAFYFSECLNTAKNKIIHKLDELSTQKVFINYDDVIVEAQHEGYVLINKNTGNAVKLVDRLVFSHNNFSDKVKKGWTK